MPIQEINKDMRLSELVSLYYSINHKINSFSIYANQQSFKKNVYPFLNDPCIGSINANDVQALIDHMKETISPNSAWGIFRELRKIMQYAADTGCLSCNPFKEITDFRYMPIVNTCFSTDELEKINKAITDTEICPMYQMALETGMSLNEMIVLTWNDIDYASGKIRIQFKAYRPNRVRDKINVQSENICYNITPAVKKILDKQLISQIDQVNKMELVFTSPSGIAVQHYVITKANRYVQNQTGITDFNFRRISTHVKHRQYQ